MKRNAVLISLSLASLAVTGPMIVSGLVQRQGAELDLASIHDASGQRAFQVRCTALANEWRERIGIGPLAPDLEIQEALRRLTAGVPPGERLELTDVFEQVQAEVPSTSSLSASVVYAMSPETLLERFHEWEDLAISDYGHLSTWFFTDGNDLGCIMVMAQKLPPFDVGALTQGGGTFFDACARCGHRHAVEIRKVSKTIVLRCPQCGGEYDLIASDSAGRCRRAMQFMTGFELPGAKSGGKDAHAEVHRLWTLVREKCDYEYDTTSGSVLHAEEWKTPEETYDSGAGDCEDTAVLLADLLISSGYDARVAIGRNRAVGDHAWCVVRIDGEEFLLESTGRRPKELKLPRVEEFGDLYEPRQQFDRSFLYFRKGGEGVTSYWADGEWERVVHPATPATMAVR